MFLYKFSNEIGTIVTRVDNNAGGRLLPLDNKH